MDELFAAGGAQECPRIADEEGALLLVPNGTNRDTGAPSGDDQNRNDCRPQGPTAADDVDFVDALLRWTADRFSDVTLSLDTARTFVTGPSNGGLMTYRLATELPDRVAAAAAFIANRPELSECPMATAPIPVLIVNGTDDPLMPYDGGSRTTTWKGHGLPGRFLTGPPANSPPQ